MKYLILISFLLAFLSACNNKVADPADQVQDHDHGAMAILQFSDGMEIFAEIDQLVEGHGVNIRAHLTFLEDYSPAKNGILYARISQENAKPDWEPLEPVQDGIFTGAVNPQEPGSCDFEFMYEEDELRVEFVEKSLHVYTHGEELPEPPPHGDKVIFTKEQAWKTTFGLMPLEMAGFSGSIHCSGEIIIAPSSKVDLISPASGKLAFIGSQLVQGSFVRKGAELFTILGTGLSHDNIILEFNTARTEYAKSKANMERKEKLVKIEAISAKDFEEAKAVYEQDKARFDILKAQISESGMIVKSPISGFVSEILGSDNSYVETGTVIIKMLKTDGVMVKANVPSLHANKIASIKSANIKFPGNSQVYSIADFGGKVLSFGHQVEASTGMIPLFIGLDKTDLISGTYVELWLATNEIPDQIIVPGSSLLEEYGQYFVYVQEEGEAYEKRPIKIGQTDGVNYQVVSGLEPGEVIVSKGGMAIKIANAMGAAPVHSH